MNILMFVLGERGSGKSTLLNWVKDNSEHSIVKPSTTRSKRCENDNEYYFITEWNSGDFYWEINVNGYKYGVSKEEINKCQNSEINFCVFEPSQFENFRKSTTFQCLSQDFHIITLGLDTLSCIKDQLGRVSGDDERRTSETQFYKNLKVIRRSNIVLTGQSSTIIKAVSSLTKIILSRGGLLTKSSMTPLLDAECLLKGASEKISPASYDLRLGDDIWCQGEFATLDSKKPVIKIPAYSYAIVSAKEVANLPSFISARFDLKNSLFFQGVILSNGPQIDPGYKGSLFCMLYNGSDIPIGIKRGEHFATIEFITTIGIDEGYSDKYQGKTSLYEFMPSTSAASKGGRILERTEEKVEEIQKNWAIFRNILLAMMALIFSPLLITYYNIFDFSSFKAIDLEDLERRVDALEKESKNSIKDKAAEHLSVQDKNAEQDDRD